VVTLDDVALVIAEPLYVTEVVRACAAVLRFAKETTSNLSVPVTVCAHDKVEVPVEDACDVASMIGAPAA